MKISPPVPENEFERLMSLSELDVDYSALQDNFKDLTKLAAKVAGTQISLVNLIDTYTQWTVSSYGLLIEQMPREDSVCQYTILSKEHFESKNLADDDRFKDKFYVTGDPHIHYYFGVPLISDAGHNIGALCVLDRNDRTLEPEKIELLKIIASEIINRINIIGVVEGLKNKLHEATETKSKVAHDIRGPLSGIIGLTQIISEQGDKNKLADVLQLIGLIQKSGTSILELADEILSTENTAMHKTVALQTNQLNLGLFKEKLEKLYTPQAMSKNIAFVVNANPGARDAVFLKNKLLQITGNLISNAIKFTPQNGSVTVNLDVLKENNVSTLQIIVTDTGAGISVQAIEAILNGSASSTNGTEGEQGYGFGLSLVKHLIGSLQGTFHIHSELLKGSAFSVHLPQVHLN